MELKTNKFLAICLAIVIINFYKIQGLTILTDTMMVDNVGCGLMLLLKKKSVNLSAVAKCIFRHCAQ